SRIGRWVSGMRAGLPGWRSSEPPVGALQQHGVLFHRRAFAHHPARYAAILERAEQLAIAEARTAQRQGPPPAPRAELDAAHVHVEALERGAAEAVANPLERGGEGIVAVEGALMPRVLVREVDARLDAGDALAPGEDFVQRADL